MASAEASRTPEEELALLGLSLAVFSRCVCGCRFRWPNHARRQAVRTLTDESEEIVELAQCPACGSTRQRRLTEPYPCAPFGEAQSGE